MEIFLSNNEENTCDQELTCYETVLRFQIWLKEMFSSEICPGLIEILDKSALILVVFNTRQHVDSLIVFKNTSFQVFK